MKNHNKAEAGKTDEQQKQSYPLDNYTVQPQTKGGGDESPFYKSQAPSIAMPKGGGALKGIDEKFNVNAVNGTASLEVPLPLTQGRSGFTPSLALSYNSGGGNGEFGLGWALSLPAIQRKTDKKLPRYEDADESDIFLFAGAEDLVPLLKTDGTIQEITSGSYTIRRYIPRIEGLFARIEHIRKANSADTWWRVTTKDNITSWYGLTADARIADPAFAHKVFKWLPQLVIDNKGNVQEYTYIAEDTVNVPKALHEQNRQNELAHHANKYLKKVGYCNKNPFFISDANAYEPALPSSPQYLMEAVFDFGDHTGDVPAYTPDVTWPCRKDPFSDFHAGFEIRTWRKCHRVLMFHSFAELGDGQNIIPVPVRSLDLSYQQENVPESLVEADFIKTITQTGYKKKPDGLSFYKKSLPPMTMAYQPLQWDTTVHQVDATDSRNAPQGLTGNYQWTDLYGEGISGILSEADNGWFYKRNMGEGHFSEAVAVATKPSFKGLGKAMQWQDLDADGRRQLVNLDNSHPGYFELDDEQHWQGFMPFRNMANINWSSPYTKMLDLDGDGRPDILITDENIWTWWANKGKKGYTKGGKSNTYWDEEKGPRLLINDAVQSVFLADMNGDGLTDLVRIKNGEVCYWPNLGYGKFGARVSMSNAPVFDNADLFNPLYLHLSDISGTGAPDLLYRSPDGITAWINLAGNGWSAPVSLGVVPSVDKDSPISVLDFLGNGTGCIVWSSSLPQHASLPMRYIDLMGGRKPFILQSYQNGMGKETALTYKSSTRYYLEDKKAGRPWATKLPFPVQCLSETTTTDAVSETTYAQSYSYHHGYYDHEEREFRGFGRVEMIDTDQAAFYALQNNSPAENDLKQYPVLTKTWNHTGAWMRESTLLDQFAKEYYQFEGWDSLPTYADFPAGLSPQEIREAHRALKGAPIRQEVYALDGSPSEETPYTVTVSTYKVLLEQYQKNNRYASFLHHPEQKVVWSCERMPMDVRVLQEINLSMDVYGNVLESAQIAYPRKHTPASLPDFVKDAQGKMHITYSTHDYTNDVETTVAYRTRVAHEVSSYELHLPDTIYPAELFTKDSFYNVLPLVSSAIDYASAPSSSVATLRRLSCQRTIFREDDAATVAPIGVLHSLAIHDQQYTLAFTKEIINRSFNNDPSNERLDDGMLQEAGYIGTNDVAGFIAVASSDPQYNWWWVPSGSAGYSSPATSFYNPVSFEDPWGNSSYTSYWTGYNLLPQTATDPIGNVTTVVDYDWRCLQPVVVKDPNLNYTEICYDALGMPVALAVKGKNPGGITEADELNYKSGDAIDADSPMDIAMQAVFFNNPEDAAEDLLGHATWRCLYDLDSQPVINSMIAREEHFRTVADHQAVENNYPESPVLMRITYTDGFGRIAMNKVLTDDDPDTNTARWIGNGKVVYNNKGNAVLQYEPYFSDTHQYDHALQAASKGVSPRVHYDPLDRAYLTEMPDGTYAHTIWDSWSQTLFDANDTAMSSSWYTERINGSMGAYEQDAAQKTIEHWNTPETTFLDTLSKPCYTIIMDTINHEIHSFIDSDIQGNHLSIIDGIGSPSIHRVQLQYKYNMLKAPVWQCSIDGGYQFILVDVAGKPSYSWDAAERRSHVIADELRRPLRHELSLPLGNGNWDQERYISEMIYGENILPAAGTLEDNNLRGRLSITHDGSGENRIDSYDFKGQPVQSLISLLKDPTLQDADWSILGAGDLSPEIFTTTPVSDALGRAVTITDAGNNITRHEYGKSGALKAVYLTHSGRNEEVYVKDIHYDAKGRRKAIWHGNNTKTKYTYNPLSFRLQCVCTINLNTNPHTIEQDLHYCHDAVGNITSVVDKALDTFFYNNNAIKPESYYTYDALYRLIQAEGREMINGNGFDKGDRFNDIDSMINATPKWDGKALQNYTQQYAYDETGNILELKHTAGIGGYTRTFKYDSNRNNYLYETSVGSDSYDYYNGGAGYDEHGNMLLMPHLDAIEWDMNKQLTLIARGHVKTWYQYSSGRRTRKYTDKGGLKEERIYLGNYELFRKYDSNDAIQSERSTVHILDDTGRIAMLEVRNKNYDSDGSEDILTRYIYSNLLQNAALELNGKGDIISYEEYHPYGTTSYQAMNANIKATAKRYRFAGKERDDESGFYYHGARYYAPWLCRWTACDPMESNNPALSPYCYCANNPVMMHDPDGKQHKEKDKKPKPHGKQKSGTNPANKQLLDAAIDVMKTSRARMKELEGPIKDYQIALKKMVNLYRTDIVFDLAMFWNYMYWGPKMGSDLVQGTSNEDFMAATLATRMGELQKMYEEYNKALFDYSAASKTLAWVLGNSNQVDFGDGLVLNKIEDTNGKGNVTNAAMGAAAIGVAIHKNKNEAKGSYVLYEIAVEGKVFKYGIADATRLTATGVPVRLAQQISKLKRILPSSMTVSSRIVDAASGISKLEMKALETAEILKFAEKNGIPIGNISHIIKYMSLELGVYKLGTKALDILSKYFKFRI